MIYYIKYKTEGNRYTMFDINCFEECDYSSGLWNVECDSTLIVKGLTFFLKDHFNKDNFDFLSFIKEATELQEIRGFLWEMHSNKPTTLEKCDKFYKSFSKEIEEKIKNFVKKYGLILETD